MRKEIELTLYVKRHLIVPGRKVRDDRSTISIRNIMRVPTYRCVKTGNPAVIASRRTIPAASCKRDAVINQRLPLILTHHCDREEMHIAPHAEFFCQRFKLSGLSCPTTNNSVL